MMEADQEGDGKLSFDEFKDMVASTDIAKQMVSRLLSLFSLRHSANDEARADDVRFCEYD